MVTELTSPNDVESVAELATDSPDDRSVPKIDISEPGAIDVLPPRPAALTTPPGVMVGVWPIISGPKMNKQLTSFDIRVRMSHVLHRSFLFTYEYFVQNGGDFRILAVVKIDCARCFTQSLFPAALG